MSKPDLADVIEAAYRRLRTGLDLADARAAREAFGDLAAVVEAALAKLEEGEG
jgi:hypothetical protein